MSAHGHGVGFLVRVEFLNEVTDGARTCQGVGPMELNIGLQVCQ